MTPHINNNFAKKRDIGQKSSLTIRAIVTDEHVNLISFGLEAGSKASKHASPDVLTDVCGFIVPLKCHGAFNKEILGFSQRDCSCHDAVVALRR